jgi:transposase
MRNESITLTTQEQKRAMVLNRIQAGQLSVRQAAEVLGISERHTRRIQAAYRKEGPAVLAHGNRGRQPATTIVQSVRQRVLELATTTYAGTNQQHLRDLLEEREGISLSRSSVHRILAQGGLLPAGTRKPPRHRRRRERKSQAGMLVQIDGSPHDWLEGRGPRLHLLAAIDDATGELVAAVFRQQEDAAGYFELLWQLVKRTGCPLALYHDRHSIFQQSSVASEHDSLREQLAGKQDPTQFGRLLTELEITSIAARSPQAKGRVERLFRTLQDRLPIELRLAGATTLEQANTLLQTYLPRFNAQFTVAAAQQESAYRP